MEEIYKLDEIRGLVIKLNPNQASCKVLIEFMTKFMAHKANMRAALEALHYHEIEPEREVI